ncbi:MAG: FKBP-type peptidyl-prolyl cis-trans isomerase N-terminal domain-containing protein [Alistipes sp.]|nr:FKBP-type peptidyl-prolyl cis-trans isomerase N-terminal domain-containing protein [Alistipes sp.]
MMKFTKYLVVVLLFGTLFFSCGKRTAELNGGADTLSYVIGLNVGKTLMEMDSTLNVEAVCAAICDTYNGTPKMTMAEARDYYLAEKTYFVHEKAKAHQEQYLTDLSKRDRKYARTRSGVTYKIIRLGDQSHTGSMSMRDTVKMVYKLTDERGRVIVESDTLRDSYRNLVKGLQEVVKLAGSGAHFNAWLPSRTAYDVAGNAELGIEANTLLNYDVEILNIKYNR